MDALNAFLDGFNHWHWWVFALALFIIELILPGVFFLWLGIAALITGAVAWLAPGLGWQADVVIFAILGLASAVVGRRYWKPANITSDDPTLNQRAAQFAGQVFVLETPIENGHGRVKVADGTWLVIGPDLPAGARVRVTGIDGARLKVESA